MTKVIPILSPLPLDCEVWSGEVVSQNSVYGGYDHEATVWPVGKHRSSLYSYRFVFHIPSEYSFPVGVEITLKVPNEPERFEEGQVFELTAKEQKLKSGRRVHGQSLRLGKNKRVYLYKKLK